MPSITSFGFLLSIFTVLIGCLRNSIGVTLEVSRTREGVAGKKKVNEFSKIYRKITRQIGSNYK